MEENIFKTIKNDCFMFNQVSYSDANKVIVGVPMDYTVTFKPGSRFGPNKIREVSINLEDYSPYFDKNIFEVAYCDIGDIVLPMGNAQKSLDKIYDVAYKIFKDDKVLVGLGGEHLITLPIVRALSDIKDDFLLLHFDAHSDLRDEYEGEMLSHSTVMKRVAEIIGSKRVYSFGIRSGTNDEFRWAKENINFYPFEVLSNVKKVANKLEGKKVYISVDLDVFDPAVFPGTGTPEAGGIFFNEIIDVLHVLKKANVEVLGMDLVELAPQFDISDTSSALASKLLREMMVAL